MKTNEIYIRDPFVLPHGGKYYMYGTRGETSWGDATGFDVFTGDDLENWDGPFEVFQGGGAFWADKHYWAPEVHEYQGAFYMFASFCKDNYWRGTQILKSDSPVGPFLPHSERPVTPRDQWCIDGTFYVSRNGTPYMVFMRELNEITRGSTQIVDDEMCAVQLSGGLKTAQGEPFTLFSGSECPQWLQLIDVNFDTEPSYPPKKRLLVEAPFLYRAENGTLFMTWSSVGPKGYLAALSRSDNGEIDGKWLHEREIFFSQDGGHGMIFKSFDDTLYFTFHMPSSLFGEERPRFMRIREEDGKRLRLDPM